uniref:Integrase catalytic domain-containing protein n=1 Tax=Tanacetum cinerariifolium TaxID=118510 RepID=A0A6L2LEU2_TANCI|nr:hypothetical protein [Tanacetum cinerariifolium]
MALMDFSNSELDLSNSGLEEFQQPEFEGYRPKTSSSVSEDNSNKVKESLDGPLVKELVSDNKLKKKIVSPTGTKIEFVRPKQQEKPVRKPVKPKAVNTTRPNLAVVNVVRENQVNAVKALAYWVWRPTKLNSASITLMKHNYIDARDRSKSEKEVIDSGCSRHMTGNMSYLSKYKEIDGGYVAFGGDPKGGKITGKGKITSKGKISTCKLDFEDVYFVKELKFNLFSVSQIVPRKNNMYSVDLKNVALSGGIENLIDHKVKIIRRDNRTEFKNKEMNQFCEEKWVKREFSVTMTPQQNGVAERKNKTLIEAARTMLADSKLPTTFWAEAVNTAWKETTWLFDIDTLTKSMNYKPAVAGNQSNGSIGEEEKKDAKDLGNEDYDVLSTKEPRVNQEKDENVNSTNNINIVSPYVNAAGIKDNALDKDIVYGCTDDPNMPNLEEINYSDDDKDVSVEANMTNLDSNIPISPILTTRIHKYHPVKQIIGDIHSAPQTRRMIKNVTNYELKKVIQALTDLSWIEAMQDELLQNKKEERGIMVRNKVRMVAYGYTQEEGIDYDEMDVKSAFLYGKIEEETLCTYLLDNGFHRGQIDKTLFIKRVKGDILLVQVYVDDIIFGSTRKEMCIEFEKMMHKKFQMSSMGELIFFLGLQTANTPMETSKTLLKDESVEDVDVHLYRSMICSLMYLTSLRPDIMFADSLFNLEAYTDSDYAGASLDKKFTTGGYQFVRSRLISWQCKKQTVVANSTTEAMYIAASNCCGQVLWIQNQMLDYGYNFMNTKIYIDNESTICIVKNPVFHSKTKHIEIRHHFIRDSNEKKLIQMIKIHKDYNIADLLIKAFDIGRIQYLIAINAIRFTLTTAGFKLILLATAKVKPVNEEAQLHAKVDGKRVVISEASIRSDLRFRDEGGIACLPNESIFEQLTLMSVERAATTATSLDGEKDRGIISKTQFTVTLDEPSFIGTSSGSGPRRQKTRGDAAAQTRPKRVSKFYNDLPLSRVN